MAGRVLDLDLDRTRLTELVDQAARSGDEVILTREGEAIAKLVPLASRRTKRRFGSARGQLTVPDDFDAPLDDFRE